MGTDGSLRESVLQQPRRHDRASQRQLTRACSESLDLIAQFPPLKRTMKFAGKDHAAIQRE